MALLHADRRPGQRRTNIEFTAFMLTAILPSSLDPTAPVDWPMNVRCPVRVVPVEYWRRTFVGELGEVAATRVDGDARGDRGGH